MNRRRGLGTFAIVVSVLLFIGMGVGLGRALQWQDATAFFVTPFLLTAALVCLGVGFHFLWGHRASPADPADRPPEPSGNGGRPSS